MLFIAVLKINENLESFSFDSSLDLEKFISVTSHLHPDAQIIVYTQKIKLAS